MPTLRRLAAGAAVASVIVGAIGASAESRFALVSAVDKDGAPVLGLGADDFVIEDGGAACEVLGVAPASYPIAVVVDTSSFARTDFQQLRDAAHQFLGALSGRDVALYATGTPPTRIVDFTRDLRQLETAVEHLFAQPDSPPRTWDAIAEAALHLVDRHSGVTRIVVVSAGGPDASGRTPREVLKAVVASRSIVDVIDLQQTHRRASAQDERSSKAVIPSQLRTDADAALLRSLSKQTLGVYERMVTASGYAISLQKVRAQIQSEMIVEYAAASGAARRLRIGIRLPGVSVRGIAVDRLPSP